MNKKYVWKWLILIALTAWSLGLVLPLGDKIKLGLDLQGGTSFLLEVDTSDLSEDAKEDASDRALEVIRNRIDELGVEEPIIYPEPKSQRIVVQIPGLKEEDHERAEKIIKRPAFLEFRMVHPDNDSLVDALFQEALVPTGYKIISLDEKNFNAQLEKQSYYKRDPALVPEGVTEKELKERLRSFEAPPTYEFMLSKEGKRGQTVYKPYFVSRRRELTGDRLKTASVDYREMGQPIVSLTFDSKGAKKFEQVTEDYAPGGQKNPSLDGRRYLGVVLDQTLYSAPFIRQAIYGGQAIIEGSFSFAEAQELAVVLRAGALPAPIKVLEERVVDPTLGRDSIDSGKRAAIYGGVTVLIFMLVYYMLAGLVANLALLLDIILIPLGMMVAAGFLSLFTSSGGGGGGATGLPTLTLPGVAGLILTIGMAVDANVLIFERIREEQKVGKRFGSAVSAGYGKVFSTIFDANITTLLTAIILFWQGSGPIRGFAITLSAGILVSMYTALVITRLFFDGLISSTSLQKLNMLSFIKGSNIDFLGKKMVAGIVSIVLIIATWTVFISKGKENFGVDFTGGDSVSFKFDTRQPVETIRASLMQAGIKEAFIQYNRELAPDAQGNIKESVDVKVAFEQGKVVKKTLESEFASSGFKVIQEDSVGAQVGSELRKKGVWAIIWALIGIIIYISFRFEFSFALGSIIALVHDILITVGIYSLLGHQLSLPIIAALLTVVGYSVNDTIVVFDRIRENLSLIRGKSRSEISNISLNQILSRTLLTSITTLLTVIMLLVFGGGAIHDFALALFIGILVGTYSSVFVATPVMLWAHREKKA
ncbi:MAG: protein translocase subunit SecD [Kiritimatiellae bacterium]|nr:protein translocase subunit SecD [Kiritimatiellia bacterium]